MESSTRFAPLVPVNPVRPVAGYVGGKRNLSRRLVAMIDAADHDVYAEPFVGMGGVFLRRTRQPRGEVINDISADVTTLFRILQRHYQAFLDELRWRFTARAEFDRLMATDPTTLTDLERAARFLYLQRTAFGGKVQGRNYGVDFARARFNLTTLEPMLGDLHDRLASVSIERMDFKAFIPRYDRAGTLFYIDPPYHGCEDDYGSGVFSEADYAALSDLLSAIEGRFILSINDTPQIRETFAGFATEEVGVTYRISGGVTQARELIITGGRGERT